MERLDNGQVEASLHYAEISARANSVEEALKQLACNAGNVLDLPNGHGRCSECNEEFTLTEMGMYQCDCGTFLSPEK